MQDAVAARRHGDVAAGAHQDGDVVPNRLYVNLAVAGALDCRFPGPCPGAQAGLRRDTFSEPEHDEARDAGEPGQPAHCPRSPVSENTVGGRRNAFIFAMYSGYIVSAPPRRASYERPEPVGQIRILRRQDGLAGQLVWHGAARNHGFSGLVARIWRHLEVGVVHPEQVGPDVRGIEVDRVVDDDGRAQVIANPLVADAHRRLVASHRAPAADVVFLQVRRGLDECVALPFAGGEAAPAVTHPLRRPRAAVHPDRRFLVAHRNAATIGADLLRGSLDVGPEAKHRHRFDGEVPRVRPADPLGHVEVLRHPALRPRAAGRRSAASRRNRRPCRCRLRSVAWAATFR